MTKALENKTAIVTGGSRGIGRAIVERLLHAGANVAFCARTPGSVQAALAELNAGDKAMAKAADVRSADEVARFVAEVEERFKRIDILVNNAGVGVFQPSG